MSSVKLNTTGGSGGSVALKGPASTTSNADVELTLPVDDGTANQYLKTDGSGALSWSTVSSGAALTGSTNNTVVTVTGANAMAGEANLTFDGSTLEVKSSAATTNDLINAVNVNARTTGTAAAGVGTKMTFWGSMTGQDNVELGQIGFHNTDVSGAHGDFVVKNRPNATSAERLRVTSSGDVKINTGNLVIGTSGKGIDFSAQTASSATGASATVELLDHYEEGTWTPDPYTGTCSHAHSYYVRIGTQVTVWTELSSFSDTSTQSIVQIQGLPFASDGNLYTLVGHCVTSNSADGDGSNSLIFNTYSMLRPFGGSSGAFSELNYANLDSNSVMYLTATYFAN